MNRQAQRTALCLILAALALCASVGIASAGNIDPGNHGFQYAWGENVGWINFKPSYGPGVTVTESAVTGFAWGENIGWINLSPTDGGVMNDGFGQLSGFAWGENVGWINFAPNGGGVKIDKIGRFGGFAWGENIGWINFSVPFGVTTAFQPLAVPMMRASGILAVVMVLAAAAMFYLRKGRDAPQP